MLGEGVEGGVRDAHGELDGDELARTDTDAVPVTAAVAVIQAVDEPLEQSLMVDVPVEATVAVAQRDAVAVIVTAEEAHDVELCDSDAVRVTVRDGERDGEVVAVCVELTEALARPVRDCEADAVSLGDPEAHGDADVDRRPEGDVQLEGVLLGVLAPESDVRAERDAEKLPLRDAPEDTDGRELALCV